MTVAVKDGREVIDVSGEYLIYSKKIVLQVFEVF